MVNFLNKQKQVKVGFCKGGCHEYNHFHAQFQGVSSANEKEPQYLENPFKINGDDRYEPIKIHIEKVYSPSGWQTFFNNLEIVE